MMIPIAVARSSSDVNAIRHVLPVLWMTSCFRIMEQMARIKGDVYVSSSSPDGGTSGEVCRLQLYLVICFAMFTIKTFLMC